MYYGARYYDPVIGRFTSVDPVVVDTTRKEFVQAFLNPQLHNAYSYVGNNPLKYTDPTGQYLETALDLISLGLSAYDFYRNPGVGTVIFLGLDSLGTLVPLPSIVGYIKNGSRAVKIIDYFRTVSTKADDMIQLTKLFVQNIAFKFGARGWTAGKAGNDVANMVGHFMKHGAEVGAKNVEEYYQMANKFIDEKQFTNVFKEGSEKIYYNQQSKMRTIVDKSGNIKSFGSVNNENVIKGYEQRVKKGNYTTE